MNSSFKTENAWSTSPFNLGTPSFVPPPPPPPNEPPPGKDGSRVSSPLKSPHHHQQQRTAAPGEVKLYVEPTLFVQRIVNPVTRALSSVLELLPIESHVVTITSEAVTPELLAREAKAKRAKEQKRVKVVEEAAAAAAQRKAAIVAATTRRRRLSGEQLPSGDAKRQKLQPAAAAAAAGQQQRRHLHGGTVLVRLSSGQIVRVPSSILKKVVDLHRVQDHHHQQPWRRQLTMTPQASTPKSTVDPTAEDETLELPFRGRLGEVLAKLSRTSRRRTKEEEEEVEVTRRQTFLNGIMRKLAESNKLTNGKSRVRAVKIRAFQGKGGQEETSNEFGSAKLSDQIDMVNRKLGVVGDDDDDDAAAAAVLPQSTAPPPAAASKGTDDASSPNPANSAADDPEKPATETNGHVEGIDSGPRSPPSREERSLPPLPPPRGGTVKRCEVLLEELNLSQRHDSTTTTTETNGSSSMAESSFSSTENEAL